MVAAIAHMKILILNTDYPDYLRWLYEQHPGLENESYDEQMRVRNESLFGTADFYSHNLRQLGHEAWDIHANNEHMQTAWAREQGDMDAITAGVDHNERSLLQTVRATLAKTPVRRLKPLVRPWLSRLRKPPEWFYSILRSQIKQCRPDVLLNQDMLTIDNRFLEEIKPFVGIVVGQHAAVSFPAAAEFDAYDLVISSFPPTVEFFRRRGIQSELNRLGFEPRLLSALWPMTARYDLTFVGGLMSVHSSRITLLERLCERFPQFKLGGPGVDHLPIGSPLRRHYMGQAWGAEMYRVLHSSRITLNHHGDVAPFANNCRLYEATGVGTLLITDWQENLQEMFEPGKEVVAYRTPEECVELIRYYLEHEDERQAIARAGQARTLRDHTYQQRMQELVEIVKHIEP
jgi:spore maturation protein CgeB